MSAHPHGGSWLGSEVEVIKTTSFTFSISGARSLLHSMFYYLSDSRSLLLNWSPTSPRSFSTPLSFA